MFRLDGGRPNDERGFIHKSFIGKAIGGLAKRLPVVGTAIGVAETALSVLGKGSRTRATSPRTRTARPTIIGQQGKELGRQLKFGNGEPPPALVPITKARVAPLTFPATTKGPGDDCIIPFQRRDPRTGECRFFLGDESGPNGGAPVGDAVMGQFGAALQPGIMTINRAVCLPGMQLALDGLCYNKGAITNTQRKWPRGRRPLLTGGDMRAISIAARAGAKLERTTKRLRTLGMMKRLPARKLAAHAHAKPVAAVSVPR